MRKLFLSTVSSLALAHTATAADLPVKAPPAKVVAASWTGFYVGVQGGAVNQHGSFRDIDVFIDTRDRVYSASRVGGLAGANAGYNFQTGNLVYGVEGDWNWNFGAKASQRDFPGVRCTPGSACPIDASYNVRWLATARARLGWAFDATLFYVTGGAAFGRVSNNVAFTNVGFPAPWGTFSQNATKVGWVVGGGIEHQLDSHWSVRAEARYVDLGRSTVNCAPSASNCVTATGGTYRGEFHNTLVMGLVALDYKF